MTAPFSRTLRSIERETAVPSTFWLATFFLLLIIWLVWFFAGAVTIYETSDSARLEARLGIYKLDAEVGGRVVQSLLDLDRRVRPGELLVELDPVTERLALQNGQAQITLARTRLAALRSEIRLESERFEFLQTANSLAIREARAQFREAQVREKLAVSELSRLRNIASSGGISDMALERLNAEAVASQERAQTLSLAAARVESSARLKEQDHFQKVSELQRQIIEVEGQLASRQSQVQRLEYLLSQRQLRAPVAGTIGTAADLELGTMVQKGQTLATIIPESEIRATSWFPASALGRIRDGQSAIIRLEAYPWTEYGVLPAIVTAVASEPQDGRFRVDFRLKETPTSMIPLVHGLVGSAEVVVEQLAPFTLMLRAAGGVLAPKPSARAQED